MESSFSAIPHDLFPVVRPNSVGIIRWVGCQLGKLLALGVDGEDIEWSSRFMMRSPWASFPQTRYTIFLPSGDQLGNLALGIPSVRSFSPVPSRLTIMILAALVLRF